MPDLVSRLCKRAIPHIPTDVRVVDANITFPAGLDFQWNGASLGNVGMPTVNVAGNAGANFELDAPVDISDVDHLTQFTRVLVTQESVDWVISGNNLTGDSIPVDELSKALTLVCSLCSW